MRQNGQRKPLPPIPQKGASANKKKNPNKKLKRRAAKQATARSERFFLSPCSKTYLQALTDPFSIEAGAACVPDLRDLPSQKVMVKGRTTIQAGPTGFGFVVVSPTSSCSNTFSVYRSTQLAPNTPIDLDVTAVGTTAELVPQFPYTTAVFVDLQARTVACGLRIRYLGTELNRSGRIIVARLPIGATFQGQTTNSILSMNSVQSIPVTRKWSTVTWVPSGDPDYEYSSSSGGMVDNDPGALGRLGILVDGTFASNSFEVEYVWHKEYISLRPQFIGLPNLTSSHSDLTGMSAIRNYFEGAIDYLGGPEVFRKALNFVSLYSPIEISHMATAGSMAFAAARAGGFM